MADSSGNVTAIVDLDPWGLETARSWNSQAQPHRYTSYERDGNQSDEAAQRRYNRWHLRFDQPDPYEGSYDLTDPQSFNRYSYTRNDPTNLIDPSGATYQFPSAEFGWENFVDGFWGYPDPSRRHIHFGDDIYDKLGKDPREFPLWADFYWYAWSGFFGLADPQQEKTVCERMADDAQSIAEGARNEYPNATNAFVLQQFNKEYGKITFGSYFAEGPLGFVGTPTSSGRNPNENRNYQGDSGFYSDFRDTLNPGEDQVHHFGAYFSAGLAGHKVMPDQHRAGDRGDGNWGDVRLADQARWLGDYLRRNPNQLNKVGQLIKDSICQGKAVPK